MSGPTGFSLGRLLVARIIIANAIVFAANTPYFLWRAYLNPRDSHGGFGEWLLHELVSDVLPVMMPLFVATAFFSVWTVRRSLAPIEALSRQVAAIDPAHLDGRLPRDGVPREILPFVDAVNSGLDRIAAGFASQKRFTANAAHELRTPLAVLKARCGSLADGTAEVLAADIDGMSRVVDQLLAVARLETRQIPLDQPVDLEEVCRRVVADLYPLAVAQRRDIGFASEGACSLPRGNARLIEDALRNLVENALRLSPEGGAVEVELTRSRVLRVLDRGPGVADAMKQEIFLPFRRDAGARGGGAGLGLGIAKDIVELHGGTLSVRDRAGGGAVFVIDLSRAGAAST